MKDMYPNLNGLQAFVVVVRKKSFTFAAKELGVSIATITRWINELENERKCKLFSSRKPLRLSVVGKRYFEALDKVILELGQISNELDHDVTSLTGNICIVAPINFAQEILTALVTQFTKHHPLINVEIKLYDGITAQELAQADLAILVDLPPPEHWVSRALGDANMLLCASPEYLKKSGEPKTVESLQHHSLIAHSNNLNWTFSALERQNRADSISVKVKPRLQAKDMSIVLQAVINGGGIGNLPLFLVKPLFEQNKLEQVLVDYISQSRPISLVYPHREHLPKKVRYLIDFLLPRISKALNFED